MNYYISEKESKQIKYLRILCAIAVVFSHAGSSTVLYENSSEIIISIKNVISYGIGNCAVPVFFLISSILLYRKEHNYFENLKRKIKTLIIPYLIMNILWIIIDYVFQSAFDVSSFYQETSIIKNWGFKELLDGFGITSHCPLCSQLWFLRDLFVLNILSPIIKKLIDKIPVISIISLLLLWLFIPKYPLYVSCFNLQSIVFWCVGYYFVKYNIHFSVLDKHVKTLGIVYVLLICFTFGMTGVFPLYSQRIAIVVGVIFFISFSSLLLNDDKILKLSEYNFIIYEFHEPLLTVIKTILKMLFPQTSVFYLAEYFISGAIVITVCVLFGYLLKKYLYSVYSLITGSR